MIKKNKILNKKLKIKRIFNKKKINKKRIKIKNQKMKIKKMFNKKKNNKKMNKNRRKNKSRLLRITNKKLMINFKKLIKIIDFILYLYVNI